MTVKKWLEETRPGLILPDLLELLDEFAEERCSVLAGKIRAQTETFDKWYEEFQKELAEQSGTGVIPNGMDKESYREAFDEGMRPADRAMQELDDLSR